MLANVSLSVFSVYLFEFCSSIFYLKNHFVFKVARSQKPIRFSNTFYTNNKKLKSIKTEANVIGLILLEIKNNNY
jgi:hypothetical protein